MNSVFCSMKNLLPESTDQENITTGHLSTNTGVNLYSPGKNPKTNLQFLTFIVNTIKAVYDNQDLLRANYFCSELTPSWC